MENSDTVVNLLRLHVADNVAVLPRAAAAGATLAFEETGLRATLGAPIGLGHKISIRPIAKGEKVLKFGVSIGSATKAIAPGEHVHLSNMTSDYLPTYVLSEENKYIKESEREASV